jgi:hypothetical protein
VFLPKSAVPRSVTVTEQKGRLILASDKLWSFFGKKRRQHWIRLVINRDTGEIVGMAIGARTKVIARNTSVPSGITSTIRTHDDAPNSVSLLVYGYPESCRFVVHETLAKGLNQAIELNGTRQVYRCCRQTTFGLTLGKRLPVIQYSNAEFGCVTKIWEIPLQLIIFTAKSQGPFFDIHS